MYNPVSTYRIQFHKEFSFKDFEKIISYLKELGVATVYASPIFESVPGSVHGYDVTHPHRINPEIGTAEDFETIQNVLKETGIGWLQDIVPNHMGFHSNNQWLMDVLEKGKESDYASFFDIFWNKGKLMVPFLGNTLEEVVEKGELQIANEGGKPVLKYYDAVYPLNKESVEQVNETGLETINNDKSQLLQIAEAQHYRLCHWQETDSEINFRRFFTINGLICLNIQDKNVFDHYHQLIKEWLQKGYVQGLRVDHIDGLYDPTEYLNHLRQLAGQDTYVVVEKILEPHEGLPTGWPLQGNTGYDFLSIVNNLFTNKKSEAAFNTFYRQLTKDRKSIHQQIHDKKAYILYEHMNGELENLYRLFKQQNLFDKRVLSRIHPDEMKTAIGELLIQCPVYRYYGNSFPLSGEEASALQNIFNRIKENGTAQKEAVEILEIALLHKPHEGDSEYNERVLPFYQRCMQFSGPLMAKGVEDTLMYTYNHLISRNEVGDSPESFGHTIEAYHQMMIERQETWPLSMNGTSTHDTKRGEDTRARLNVLSDIPEEWFAAVNEWRKLNADLKTNGYPDANDEYLIYQSLVGHYPMPGESDENFSDRLSAFLEKALREAKRHSNWTTPNEEYESATIHFAKALLDKNKPFWKSFETFLNKIIDHGIINSISQVALKFTSPSLPDVYQGCELWNLSFVDPDNRRPVNYVQCAEWLSEIKTLEAANKFADLWNERYSGKIKLWLTYQLLQIRKRYKELFHIGDYVPLKTEGKYKDHILAYARRYKETIIVTAIPLHTAEITATQDSEDSKIDWQDTKIIFSEEMIGEIENLLDENRYADAKSLSADDLFKQFPIAILKSQLGVKERGAGILLHITSLSSPFGIGDLGPEAKAFADFLHRNGQKYWQLLPINPTEGGQGYSPYSAISSNAGYPLLISPELLVKDGLLSGDDVSPYYQPSYDRADYAKAEEIKTGLFTKAWEHFKSGKAEHLKTPYETFCNKEKNWLDDFALYAVLKKENGGKPWYEWKEDLKDRQQKALDSFKKKHKEEIEKTRWLQFIFDKQWKELKDYCNNRNIQLIGDMPFYVSYDSSDVWANKEIFALDEQGNRTGMAGVPPDAFSADGQLWGMPVFKWDVLKDRSYDWWIQRLRKNMELYDITRLDHFRAFAAYWEVPAAETTAKNGKWIEGPGKDFFDVAYKELGTLPFVAEDLGDIDDAVYAVRDAYHLPGMKVLQFAFGEDISHTPHIPHNYNNNFLVYTGTHDNNTTRGWYRQEADEGMKKRLEQYVGRVVYDSEIHLQLGRMAYSSVAKIAILPMQDVLGLDETARMNMPGSGENNWSWRLLPRQLLKDVEHRLREWVWVYNR
jgi:malto-oligosyltrehalose synthase/4-alpha-glucanotransferase